MLREMMHGKLHQAAVTGCRLDDQGSISIDEDLLDAAGILVHQRVQVANLNTGGRFETYTIAAPRGSRTVLINGAAARLAQQGDRVIIIAYALFSDDEARRLVPKVILLDAGNRVVKPAV